MKRRGDGEMSRTTKWRRERERKQRLAKQKLCQCELHQGNYSSTKTHSKRVCRSNPCAASSDLEKNHGEQGLASSSGHESEFTGELEQNDADQELLASRSEHESEFTGELEQNYGDQAGLASSSDHEFEFARELVEQSPGDEGVGCGSEDFRNQSSGHSSDEEVPSNFEDVPFPGSEISEDSSTPLAGANFIILDDEQMHLENQQDAITTPTNHKDAGFLECHNEGDPSPSHTSSTNADSDPNYYEGTQSPEREENPDDPDDPHYSGSEADANDPSDDSDNDDPTDNFSLDHGSLNTFLQVIQQCTAREAVVLVLALCLRHNHTYESLIHTFTIMNTMLGRKYFPNSKKKLWSILSRSSAGIVKHAYCSQCSKYIGILKRLPQEIVCDCGLRVNKKKVKHFITLSLQKQLHKFLSTPHIWNCIQYRQTRHKHHPNNSDDIFDGISYLEMQQGENVLANPYNFSYTFNTDGFKLTSSSRTSAWPIYIRLNEVHPFSRQKHVFLAGLWVDTKEPCMNIFLAPFVKETNLLAARGIAWKPNGTDEVLSRFFPTCFCVDAMARCIIINMSPPTGFYGCPFCDHAGITLGGAVKYPLPGTKVKVPQVPLREEVEITIPEPQLRNDENIKAAMIEAYEREEPVKGIKGPSALMNLNGFDLGTGFSTDDLHPIFKGLTEHHTELLCKGVGKPYYIGSSEKKTLISNRIINTKTPTHIARKPRSLAERAKWKGTEWRNWLLFYAVPCLQNIIPRQYINHIALLSNAVFLLSRDSISQNDIEEAERSLKMYASLFQQYFGPENMRYNVHVVTCHVVTCVRNWGPLWAHSTFPYESWNRKLMLKVKSPKGVIDQIITRYLMTSLIANIPYSNVISDRIKEEVDFIMNGVKLQTAVKVGEVYLLGKGVVRHSTVEEQQILADEGYACNRLTEYKRAKMQGIECRSAKYRGEDDRSDNSILYTHDDVFCCISAIIVFEDNGNNVCGLFVKDYDLEGVVSHASHIVKVRESDEVNFIPPQSVRNLAIKMCVAGQLYITPMANHVEID